jgi:hypothetical protein
MARRTTRRQAWRKFEWRGGVIAVVLVTAFLSTATFWWDELFPEQKRPHISAVVRWIPWWGWVMTALVSIVVIVVEEARKLANDLEDKLEAERNTHGLKSEWRSLESRFPSYPHTLRVSWSQFEGTPQLHWQVESDSDALQKQDFATSMEEGGKLLTKSKYARDAFPQQLLGETPVDKWMNVVCAITGRRLKACAGDKHDGVNTKAYGYLENVPRLCAIACHHLAAQEIAEEPLD